MHVLVTERDALNNREVGPFSSKPLGCLVGRIDSTDGVGRSAMVPHRHIGGAGNGKSGGGEQVLAGDTIAELRDGLLNDPLWSGVLDEPDQWLDLRRELHYLMHNLASCSYCLRSGLEAEARPGALGAIISARDSRERGVPRILLDGLKRKPLHFLDTWDG